MDIVYVILFLINSGSFYRNIYQNLWITNIYTVMCVGYTFLYDMPLMSIISLLNLFFYYNRKGNDDNRFDNNILFLGGIVR